MSLRTYSLVTHPAFLRHVEALRFHSERFANEAPVDVPVHRPLLRHCSDIGRYLGISPLVVLGILRNADRHYRTFEFKKKSGGMREINAPRTYLKVLQWWILDTILETTDPSPFAHGFTKGRSFVTNAQFHVGAKHILNVDIKDFFPSISEKLVIEAFLSFGFRLGLASDLAKLTTYEGRLPQGAPTSPSIANLVFRRCDGELGEIAAQFGLRYTRYADDLTFSSQSRIPEDLVGKIKGALHPLGLQLNESKTRFMGPNDKLEVTGLVIGKEGVVLDREFLNGLRGWFHKATHHPHDHVGQVSRISGALALLRQVGGRGTPRLIQAGQAALKAISRSELAIVTE